MVAETVHNPDRFMGDFRQLLSQGRKRIGLLLGAGIPTSVRVDDNGNLSNDGKPLIPDVARLTDVVLQELEDDDRKVVDQIIDGLGENPNIEAILTQVRKLAQAIGAAEIHGVNGEGYKSLGETICKIIGENVDAELPKENNPFTELISWIAGVQRENPIEIFTPNYDLLIEEAFERARLPYFDGFTGAHNPFFDAVSIYSDELPARWSRVWKIHGSLGWDVQGETVIRTGSRQATKLIYPDHLKYDEITRLPYSALFERLREFLLTPDTVLVCSGFSFFDAHICAVLDEALAANSNTAILAFQFRKLDEEKLAAKLAFKRPNLSVYARDGAVINGVSGKWVPGELPNEDWREIRKTFWEEGKDSEPAQFSLGDFARLARFFALAQTERLRQLAVDPTEVQGALATILEAAGDGNAAS